MKVIQEIKLQHSTETNKTFTVTLYSSDNQSSVVKYNYTINNIEQEVFEKTQTPVNRSKAQLIFDNLVNYKLQKGYEYTQKVDRKKICSLPVTKRIAQNEGVLKRLVKAAAGNDDESWSASRLIWRAGELNVVEAVPYLLKLSNRKEKIQEYSLIWTLGRLGDKQALPFLKKTFKVNTKAKKETILDNITREALVNIFNEEDLKEFNQQLIAELPADFQAVMNTDESTILNWLNENCLKNKKTNEILPVVYIISKTYGLVRKALLTFVETVPMKPKHFKGLRKVFKAAEFRKDGEMFGVLAFRLDTNRENYNAGSYYAYTDEGSINTKEGQKTGKLAFSDKTKAYFQKRIWRTLKRMGEANDSKYVDLAKNFLTHFGHSTHVPAPEVKWNLNREIGRYIKRTNRFDSQSDKINLYHILYSNSPRYSLRRGMKSWTCDEGYNVGDAAPDVQEEAFPELWNAQPTAFLELMEKSNAGRVHEFAYKNLKQHAQYQKVVKGITVSQIIGFLSKPFAQTNEFALQLAQEFYNPEKPNIELVIALLNCELETANKIAHNWIATNRGFFFKDLDFVFQAITCSNKNTNNWITSNYNPNLLNQSEKNTLIEKLFKHLLQVTNNQNQVTKFLKTHFSQELTSISLTWIEAFLNCNSKELQIFAGELLQNHTAPVETLPEELIQAMLDSELAEIRTIGLAILAKYSDETLLERKESLTAACSSPLADVRQAVRPIIQRLAAKDENFATKLVEDFVKTLLRKEKYDGLHQDMLHLLTNELEAHLQTVPRKIIFRLLNSKYSSGQILGITLVQKYVPSSSLSVSNIIRLADHEMLAARQTAWKMFNENIGRIRYEREEAIRLFDSDWDDSRAFAFDFFRTHYVAGDWTPEILVGICDSVREDVQTFGRELMTKFFTEDKATEYLLKLSQHPATKMQNFAARYLQDYATDNLEMLEKLEFYCKVVLLKVNKARTAKNLVFTFLHQESIKSEEAAKVVIRILKRVSLTVAITDKAKCIEILRDIQAVFPELETPLKVAA